MKRLEGAVAGGSEQGGGWGWGGWGQSLWTSVSSVASAQKLGELKRCVGACVYLCMCPCMCMPMRPYIRVSVHGCVHVLMYFHCSCQGQLGQGLTSVIHQVEEGLGLTNSEGAAPPDTSQGERKKEGTGQEEDSKSGGEQKGTTGEQLTLLRTYFWSPISGILPKLSCRTALTLNG